MKQRRPDGKLYAVAGAARSGKTAWVSQRVAGVSRLLVWDYKSEWYVRYRCRRVQSIHELAALVRPGAPPARLAFCPTTGMDAKSFDQWCRLAFVWLRADMGTLVVEETASVTSPAKAPPGWGNILRMALGFGCDIYAITQRPAESDKTSFGNASVLHTHRLARSADRKFMAQEMDVELARISALQPLQWIERDAFGQVVTGVVQFKKSRK